MKDNITLKDSDLNKVTGAGQEPEEFEFNTQGKPTSEKKPNDPNSPISVGGLSKEETLEKIKNNMSQKIDDNLLTKIIGGEYIQKSGITCPSCGQDTVYLMVSDDTYIEMCSRCTYFKSNR